MHIFLFNLLWMSWNTFLAVVGVLFSWLIFRAKSWHIKLLLFPLWLVFVPNTIYIITDVIHIPQQLPYVEGAMQIFILAQFLVFLPLGLITFYLSLRYFEQGIRVLYKKFTLSQVMRIEAIIIVLNFLIALGVTMGRLHRTNSWQLVTDIYRVFGDIGKVLTSSHQLTITILFGILINVLYFFLRQVLVRTSR